MIDDQVNKIRPGKIYLVFAGSKAHVTSAGQWQNNTPQYYAVFTLNFMN
jgi:hypothetical protein